MTWYGAMSYGICALVYGTTAILLLLGRPKGGRAIAVIAAAGVTALWAVVAVRSVRGDGVFAVSVALDAVHALAWTLAILSFLASSTTGAASSVRRWLGGAAASLALAVVSLLAVDAGAQNARPLVFVALVAMAVTGLLAVEQVFRNAGDEQRKPFRLLCLAIGGIFTADLFVYSHATLLGGLVPALWDSRGIANALCAPLILIALRRDPAWTRGVFVSRYVAFYTASLLGVGVYLICMG